MTYFELSKKLKISESILKRIETGKYSEITLKQIKYISECLNISLDEMLFLNNSKKNYREGGDSELCQQYLNLDNLDRSNNKSDIKKILSKIEKEILRRQLKPQLYLSKDEYELISYYNMIENQVTKWQVIGKLIELGKKENKYNNNIIYIDFHNRKKL
ncbi:XRE family transcriptional regulator [Eubacterium sp. AM05-23]|uniref:helix-turn-helix domain-containing protein n=1 Tax=Eubacterium TaxID=1730 RepID=UPI000E4F5676|nr:XRE family transcriptional regulator [Eubacterium sp. AM05-23]